jgi:hypothetical protein
MGPHPQHTTTTVGGQQKTLSKYYTLYPAKVSTQIILEETSERHLVPVQQSGSIVATTIEGQVDTSIKRSIEANTYQIKVISK